MVVLRSFVTLALAAFVAAGASPSRTTPTLELSFNPPLTAVKAFSDASVEKRSVSEVETLTNAKRFELGLPPLPPTMHKRAYSLNARHHPKPSSSPRPHQPYKHCGTLAVLDKSHKRIGYVGKVPNSFGEYTIAQTKDDALCVCYKPNGWKPVDITIDNGPLAEKHYQFGAIQGFADKNGNLQKGSYDYAYLGGSGKTPAYSKPKSVGNSFTEASTIAAVSESAIWVVDPVSHNAVAHYVNPNGSKPNVQIAYAQDSLVVTGDAAVFASNFGTTQIITLKFLGN